MMFPVLCSRFYQYSLSPWRGWGSGLEINRVLSRSDYSFARVSFPVKSRLMSRVQYSYNRAIGMSLFR